MTTRHAASARPRTARHSRHERTHRALSGLALVTVGVLSFGVVGGATAYTKFQGNVDTADVTDLLGDRPTPTATPDPNDPNAGKAVTILIMGSDVRDGENAEIGGEVSGMRSDTTIVMHIAADRSRIEAVSIPRDSLVKIPACERSDGTTSKAQTGQFNAAFSIGSESGETSDAAACTIKTVEQTTGVFVDHFVVVDFAGFISMVDALGGIPMCIPNDMSAPKSGLEVTAGQQTLDGSTALAYARARTGTGVGDGSDTNRLGRQQKLLAATVREVLSKNLLTDVPSLIRFLDAATSSITVDPGLSSITDMTGLAFGLKDVPTGNISFMTIPFGAAPSDPNRVVWTDAADTIWANIAADRPMNQTESETESGPTQPATSGSTSAATTAPVVVPTPAETKEAGKEEFSADDITDSCS